MTSSLIYENGEPALVICSAGDGLIITHTAGDNEEDADKRWRLSDGNGTRAGSEAPEKQDNIRPELGRDLAPADNAEDDISESRLELREGLWVV